MLNDLAYRETMEFGGQDQIPSLVGTGQEEALYESDDSAEGSSASYRT